MAKKKPPKFSQKPDARKKGKGWTRAEWVVIGVDVSTYSISLSGMAKTREGKIRVKSISRRWVANTDYFKRMEEVAKAHDLVHDLLAKLKVMVELENIYFAIEEAVPIGALQRSKSNKSAKQQLQISGAFIGGLLRYGYKQLWEIQWQQWAAVVAKDLGLTTHHTKWNPTKKEGKYRAQEWVKKFHPKWDGGWPDLVRNSKLGLVPRGDSKAQGIQSDDRYESLGIMWFMRCELKKEGALKNKSKPKVNLGNEPR